MVNQVKVPYVFLEACAKISSSGTLDMYEPPKSRGKVIEWKKRHWVCTGSAWKERYLEAYLNLCVPEANYHGPHNDPYSGPDLYYVGGRFTCRGQAWVMTDKEITLVPDTEQRR